MVLLTSPVLLTANWGAHLLEVPVMCESCVEGKVGISSSGLAAEAAGTTNAVTLCSLRCAFGGRRSAAGLSRFRPAEVTMGNSFKIGNNL